MEVEDTLFYLCVLGLISLAIYLVRIMRQLDEGYAGVQVESFVPEQAMRTAYNPFVIELMPKVSSLKDGARLKLTAGEGGYLLSCWGVTIKDIYPLLYMVPSDLRKMFSNSQKALDTLQLYSLGAKMTRMDCCEDSELTLCPDIPVDLGPVPRDRYPLVIILVSDFLSVSPSDDAEHIVFHGLIIHLKDDVLSSIESHIISHIVRTVNGKPVNLKHLYTSDMHETNSSSDSQLNPVNPSSNPNQGNPAESRDCDNTSTATCIVCLVSDVNKVILPCRHACVCDTCFEQVSNCPMCRGPIQCCFSLIDRQEENRGDEGEEEGGQPVQSLNWFERLNDWLNRKLGFT